MNLPCSYSPFDNKSLYLCLARTAIEYASLAASKGETEAFLQCREVYLFPASVPNVDHGLLVQPNPAIEIMACRGTTIQAILAVFQNYTHFGSERGQSPGVIEPV